LLILYCVTLVRLKCSWKREMLISVVYSDGQILFCNADCVSANLLNYVRRQTGNYDCEVVDLADESGNLLTPKPDNEIVHN